jgi:hypothetical protein
MQSLSTCGVSTIAPFASKDALVPLLFKDLQTGVFEERGTKM